MVFFSFRKKYSSRLIQICYAGINFIYNKYGNYDRQKYKIIDKYFSKINKQTSIIDVINLINDRNKI